MRDPRSTSPGSVMPPYPWMLHDRYDVADIQASLRALSRVGVPYTDADIEGAPAAIEAQARGIFDRLATAGITAEPDRDIIAMIAYLQRLGMDGRAAIKAAAAQAP
jgi:cytochrome c oxidase cbb3-type subunit I/II